MSHVVAYSILRVRSENYMSIIYMLCQETDTNLVAHMLIGIN